MTSVIPGHHPNKLDDEVVMVESSPYTEVGGEETEYVCMRRKKEAKKERKLRSREHQYVLIIIIIISLLVLGAIWSRLYNSMCNLFCDENNLSANLIIAVIITLLFFTIIYAVEIDDML